jgi:hypothetical protein
MTKVTEEQLTKALDAWKVAQEKALLEQKAWGTLTQNHGSLIASLRQHGHTWSQAEEEFGKFSKAHREAVLATHRNMDTLCEEYQLLLAKFKSQQP